MSRLFATFTQPRAPVAPLLRLVPEQARIAAAENRHGYGIGFSQADEILLQRRPQLRDQAIDLLAAAGDIQSTAFLAQVRRAEIGGLTMENTQPFRFGPWMYAQVGTLPACAQVAASLGAELPDSLRINVRGETDAELLFHAFLARLHDAGVSPRRWRVEPRVVGDALLDAVARWQAAARSVGAEQPLAVALIATNGQSMYALTLGRPLWVAALDTVQPAPPADEAQAMLGLALADPPAGPAAAYVFIDGDEPPRHPAFRRVPGGHLATVDSDLVLTWRALPQTGA